MLTKEILCAYLPYDVKGVLQPQTEIVTITGFFEDKFGLHEVGIDYIGAYAMSRLKLCLRPLSSLTKPITHNGETFVPMDILGKEFGVKLDGDGDLMLDYYHIGETDSPWTGFNIMQKLLSWHFDLWELIPSGHAIELKEIENG